LLAARIVDRIQHTFGKKLPLTTFFAGATIERLAVAIQEEHQHTIARASVVTVQASGAKYPFFFLHGDWAGGGFYCRELSGYLGSDQPFYILEPYKFLDLPVPPTFEAMAAAHIEAMRAVQPEGPYLLGGFCNGGLMAYEMARQLQAQGQRVDLLALIDPAAPRQHKVVRDCIGCFGKVVHLSEEKQVNLFLRYIYLRIPAYRHKVQNGTPASLAEQLDPEPKRKKKRSLSAKVAAFFPKARALHSQWAGIYRWVVSSYVPGTYDGNITFLWSSAAYNENQQWHKLTGTTSDENEIHIFSGTHSSSKTINLPIIAEKLGQCLENLETRK
jgi:thioesterase domain-containing protein